jgi:hypothetical protein
MQRPIDRQDAVRRLREGGILNPERFVSLIQNTIELLNLDLSGLTVLTEAASGAYVCTPVIAALAGAERVFALTRDSQYARAKTVIRLTRTLEQLCGIPNKVEIFTKHSPDLFARADIITNLGFVRPIDEEAVAVMKPTAVIPLMCEAWEYRDGDVDLDACRLKGVSVFATNEDYPGLEIFAYSGLLCMNMLFNAGIEVRRSTIIVVSGDKFGTVISRQLSDARATVCQVTTLQQISANRLANADALVVADYRRDDIIIGTDGDLSVEVLANSAPGLTVVQFAGCIDVQALKERGIMVYPGIELEARRMAMTLAALGPRPVVELHTAGLKVGEIALCQYQSIARSLQHPYLALIQPLAHKTSTHSTALHSTPNFC